MLGLSHLPMQLKTLITFAYEARIRHTLVHQNPSSIANKNPPRLSGCHENLYAHTCVKVVVLAPSTVGHSATTTTRDTSSRQAPAEI